MNRYYAHSTGNPDKSDWQPLKDHLAAVGDLAARKASAFGGESLAQVAGLLHDLGKYTTEFQKRIEGVGIRVDHATRGAIVARELYGPIGHLLAYAIAGHHAGLANGRDSGARSSLEARMQASLPELVSQWRDEITLPAHLDLTADFKPDATRASFELAFLARMVFSSLVDADFIDTENFYLRIGSKRTPRQTSYPPLETLLNALNEHLSGFVADTPVNLLRSSILSHVRSQATQEPGLFSLNVPTGGGKTLTSLAFALDHALRHGLRRVIYVIPFTSIVEQNAAVFRKALGEFGETAVLEHHSAFTDDPASAPESRDKLAMAMENWEPPIIVTTAVQFFESLFASRPSRCRKLHNIAQSVIILDEAQTMPIKLLRPSIVALDELARNYRTSVIFCTATQPALKKTDGFRNGLEKVRELAPAPDDLHQQLARVRLRHIGRRTDEELIQELDGRDQVLCIVNNRRHARALFDGIAHLPGARHLTTLMCAKHRQQVLAEVRELLRAGQPCRLVSTSLIEAGVDVDFPTVLRAEAGLDSIAQAAGRCNREGKRPASVSEVRVFEVASDWPTPPELIQFAQAARTVFRQYGEDCLSLDAINAYFKELYWQKGDQALDEHNLLGMIEDGKLENLPFEELSARFQMIESTMEPVVIPRDDCVKRTIEALRHAEHVGKLGRELQPYLVQVPRTALKALDSSGALETLQPKQLGSQFKVLINMDLYNETCGLSWEDPTFLQADRCIL